MKKLQLFSIPYAVLLLVLTTPITYADEPRNEYGLRANVLLVAGILEVAVLS